MMLLNWNRMFLRFVARRGYSSSALPVLPACDFKPTPYKGIKYEEALGVRKNRLGPTMHLLYKRPIMITQGHMQWLWDDSGKRYLDMFGGIVTISVGHCHSTVTKVAVEQLQSLWHVTNIYLHPTIHEYAQKLTDHLPEDLKVCYFCNSGSEANDLAMMLARKYTGAFDILSLRNAYHGDSPYTMGLCGVGSWKHSFPNGFGVHHVMNPDPYHGIWGGSNCRDSPVQTTRSCSCGAGQCIASDKYIEQLEQFLSCSVPPKIAGFFAESIQGVGGTVQFTKGYLKRAFELIRQRGGLCIIDEVQTGFGRTGSNFWGFQSHGVIPDIVTMAKGIGNGFPLAAVVTRPEIAKCLTEALLFNTFGGNPISCAVGSSVLDVIDEEKLMENSHHVGTHLLHSLAKLRQKYEIVGDVRGKGLMIGLELVKDKITKEPLPKSDVEIIFEDTKDMGILVGRGGNFSNVLRIKPPMCITRADADFCVAVLDNAINNFLQK